MLEHILGHLRHWWVPLWRIKWQRGRTWEGVQAAVRNSGNHQTSATEQMAAIFLAPTPQLAAGTVVPVLLLSGRQATMLQGQLQIGVILCFKNTGCHGIGTTVSRGVLHAKDTQQPPAINEAWLPGFVCCSACDA